MDVMLVAAPREMIESRIDTVERIGLEAVAIDLEAFALQRALMDCNRSRYDDGQLRALVDIGAAHTEVSIVTGTTFSLTRSIQIAGDTFSDVLKNQLRMDTAEAEKRKSEMDMSLILTGGPSEALEGPKAIQSVLDELLREIRRSINFYQSQLPEGTEAQPLQEIILTGGSSAMNGLASYMTARLATETRVADVFDNPIFEAAPEAAPWLQEQAPRLGTAMGLAVKEYLNTPLTGKG
jgi:type IV pilus assembly protein PilM